MKWSIPRAPRHADAEPEVEPPGWGCLEDVLGVDPLTGIGTASIPIRVSPGRMGFTPELDLRYNSQWGNSPYGMGWRIDVPAISCRKHPEVPRYKGADDDGFQIDEDELLPALRVSGGWIDDRFTVGEYVVQRYRRRHEYKHERIERWSHQPSGQTHWRVVDAHNVTSLYGSNDLSRVNDPTDPAKIGMWLLAERFDDRGNVMRFAYERENFAGVDLEAPNEKHRFDQPAAQGAARYLKRIDYGNSAPHDRDRWHFCVVFDYGDHDDEAPSTKPQRPWFVRPDPFSDYRSGFEIRVWRRCRRVLMFHHFDELAPEPVLVGATTLVHDSTPGYSLLKSLRYTGYVDRSSASSGASDERSLPALTMEYEPAKYDDTVHSLDADAIVNTLVDPNSRARWMDLHHEGLPGVVSRLGNSWYYARNLGHGRFAEPELVGDILEDANEPEILDLTGSAGLKGPSHGPAYQPMTTLRTTADVNQDDPYIGYLDLNGDQADDVVVADEQVIRWYPSRGEEGFDDPFVLKLDGGQHSQALRLHAERHQSFHVADMNGDGLYDLVRVRGNEVCYWPNQGRGRFGDRVVVESSPQLPDGEVGAGRILLVDINGSGTNDLVWVGDGEIMYWENRSGNHFGPARRVSAPGIKHDEPGVSAVDLLGQGTACILWIDRSQGPAQLRYLSPLGNRRPNLLIGMNNGRGFEARVNYEPSTHFWLQDRAAGGSWLTAMPQPVYVVERMESRDSIARTRKLVRFAYHHGFYDTHEHRFAGFAAVERWDSGTADDYNRPGLFPDRPVPYMSELQKPVPLLTKTWRHTGTQFEDSDLTVPLKEEFFNDLNLGRRKWLSGHQMPLGQQAKDIPEGHRALRGQLLRRELYALDGPPKQDIPYLVEERTAWVRQTQPSRSGVPPSYEVRENETVTACYERSVGDPRIQHKVVLSLDEMGGEARFAEISYGRRNPEHPLQAISHVLVTENTNINRVDQTTWYRTGVPAERRRFRMVMDGNPATGRLFEARELRGALEDLIELAPGQESDKPHKVLVARQRWRYWSNDLSRQLPIGVLESRALLARSEHLVYTAPMVAAHFGDGEASKVLQYEGGYEVDGEMWWAPGETVTYDPSHFFLPISRRDALGCEIAYRWDSESLEIEEEQDAFGNLSRYRLHPRSLRPWQEIDANDNITATRFDALGVLLSRASLGKSEAHDGDVIALGSLEASAHDDPTMVVTYSLDAGTEQNQPSWVRTRHRERHRDAKTRLQDMIVHYDGGGRRYASAWRAGDRWLLSDLVERDGNGKIVARADPFIHHDNLADEQARRTAFARSTRTHRDALGRMQRHDFPDGTFISQEIRSWEIVKSDCNDNVLESSWYADRQGATQGRAGDFHSRQATGANYEMRAAALAAAHARMPDVDLLDASGRVVVERRPVSTTQTIERSVHRDWTGRVIARVNGRGQVVERIARDLLGRPISVIDADAGTTTYSYAANGRLLRRRDAEGRVIRHRYDAAGRITHTLFRSGSGPEQLLERIIYGGGDVAVPDAKINNLVGLPHVKLHGGGLELIYRRNLHGAATRRSLRLPLDGASAPDWSAVSELNHLGQLRAALFAGDEPMLSNEELIIEEEFDASGRSMKAFGPGGIEIERSYGTRGVLASARVQMEGMGEPRSIVGEARYDAADRATLVRLGNGMTLNRGYDPCGRVNHLATSDSERRSLGNLRVVRDACGNVMSVSDDVQLLESFTYDGSNRMIRAEGLETTTDGAGSEEPARYVRTYLLDVEGNVVEVQHRSGSTDAAARVDYQPGGNRVRAMSLPGEREGGFSATYQHDDRGNVIGTPQGESLRWDPLGRLSSVCRDDGTDVSYSYGTDGELIRRLVKRAGSATHETVVFSDFERRRRYEHDQLTFEQYAASLWHGGAPLASVERITRQASEDQQPPHSIRYDLVDHIGSVVEERSQEGERLTSETFLPYGAPATRSARTDMELATKRFGFRSGRYDSDAELLLLGTRWYSPLLGRWINAEDKSSTNPYLFMHANPQLSFPGRFDDGAPERLAEVADNCIRSLGADADRYNSF